MHEIADSRSNPHRCKYTSLLAETVFHEGYVAMECFLSDWYVRCIKLLPKTFLDKRREEVEGIMREAEGQIKKDYGEATRTDFLACESKTPSKLTVESIRQYLDPKQYNVTFKGFGGLKREASKYLSTKWSQKVDHVPPLRQEILDTACSIRNFIAHNSQRSRENMDGAIRKIGHPDLRLGSRNAGSKPAQKQKKPPIKREAGPYLRAETSETSEIAQSKKNASRLELFFREFKALADDLTR
jgi:hypothetical protein